MKARPALGMVDRENLKKVTRALSEKHLKPDTFGLSYLEDYVKGKEPSTKAYGYLNALGYEYGYVLAEAFLSDFLAADDPDQAAAAAAQASRDIRTWLVDVMSRAEPMDLHLVREAIREVGERMPKGAPPEEMVRVGQQYSNGMYIRDFSYSLAGALQAAMWAADRYLSWHKVPYAVSYENGEYIPDMFQDPSREMLKDAVRIANNEIKNRTYYGMRNTKLPDHPNFTVLAWSNGAEAWRIMYGMIDPLVRQVMIDGGGTERLDANYILVPVHPAVMRLVVDEIDPLPLFEYSFEAKLRGKYPHADERTVRKVLRAIVDAEFPNEDVEERAVLAIEMWEALNRAKMGDPMAQNEIDVFFRGLQQNSMPYLKVLTDWLDLK